MKYFIKAKWWRDCHFMPSCSNNFVIEEEPNIWLERQRKRLIGSEWTDIIINSCCQIEDNTECSPDPDFRAGEVSDTVIEKKLLKNIKNGFGI